jgi:hypothetical protein
MPTFFLVEEEEENQLLTLTLEERIARAPVRPRPGPSRHEKDLVILKAMELALQQGTWNQSMDTFYREWIKKQEEEK